MKARLTPKIAYFIGFWRGRRCPKALGFRRSEYAEEVMREMVESLKLERELNRDSKCVWIYEYSLRKFFFKIVENEIERFKHLNDHSANYLAGIFDSCGEISERGKIIIRDWDESLERVLHSLGFYPIRKRDGITVGKGRAFALFIREFSKRMKKLKVE